MKQEYKKEEEKTQPESNRRSPYDFLQDRTYWSIVKVLLLQNVNAKSHHEKGEMFPGQADHYWRRKKTQVFKMLQRYINASKKSTYLKSTNIHTNTHKYNKYVLWRSILFNREQTKNMLKK